MHGILLYYLDQWEFAFFKHCICSNIMQYELIFLFIIQFLCFVLCRKTIKLFSDFYTSDFIIASALCLVNVSSFFSLFNLLFVSYLTLETSVCSFQIRVLCLILTSFPYILVGQLFSFLFINVFGGRKYVKTDHKYQGKDKTFS